MQRPIAIDLFAGCGGMSLGLEAAGFDIAAAVEFDAVHTLVHHFNFPYGASICKDIAAVKSQDLLRAVERKGFHRDIDLIAGGPPCQGFSHIGKRQLDDPRNSLVFEYLRIIKEIKPKYFLFENVPGIASGQHKKFLEELIIEFGNIGYAVQKPIAILNAAYYGAPQQRKRLILMGSRYDVDPAIYPEKTHLEINSEQFCTVNHQLRQISTCEQAIGDLVKHNVYLQGDHGINSSQLDYSGFRKSFSMKPSKKFKLCHIRTVSYQVYGHIGSNHTKRSIDRFEVTTPGTVEPISRFFKLSPDGQCNTLRAGTTSDKGAYTAPRPIHYAVPRCITVREAARLHTFPDWFRFHNTIWHGFREIGNSVIPFLSKALGSEIIKAMRLNPEDFGVYTLDQQDEKLLNYNMGQASKYWDIPDNVIPKRKRATNGKT